MEKVIMYDNKQLWENALVEIELNISKANFSTWFKKTYIVKLEDGIVHLGVPNAFAKEWLYNKYHKFILKALRDISTHIRGLEYTICKNEPNTDAKQEHQLYQPINSELPLSDLYINKEDNLNPKYTFESFIIGAFNELAHAAAQAVVKKPGLIYNPLFIYGGTGLGKTHLIQAIGNYVKKVDTNKKVHYITSEKFSMDYINSLQQNKINTFKEKYRKYDILIMDDIQFLSNKEKTQEELFHVFNSLYDNNKQIIFSSDKHPAYIPEIEERLKSRFSAGMIVDVSEPEYESRLAILKAKSALQSYAIPDESIQYLATEIQGNIRELEGILNSVIMQSQLKKRFLNINELRNILKNNTKPKKSISTKDVIKLVSNFYNINEDSIYEKTRRKEVVKPRQIVMYILREDFHVSYPSIGNEMGGRDHTTVIHSCEKIRNDLKENNLLVQEIEQIRAMF
jgi:chromosomal replication initiator protein